MSDKDFYKLKFIGVSHPRCVASSWYLDIFYKEVFWYLETSITLCVVLCMMANIINQLETDWYIMEILQALKYNA